MMRQGNKLTCHWTGIKIIQLNLFTLAALGTEESGHCGEVNRRPVTLSAGLLSGRSHFQTTARPTLRVLRQPKTMCCLCCDICKWLDFLVFSDKDEKP